MTDIDIDAICPATDLLLANLRETLAQVREHDHPASGGDLFCLNLTSYMGDRMGPVLRRLADEQAETRKWQEKHTALADEFLAEADRLHAKVDELTVALAAAREHDALKADHLVTANRRAQGLEADLRSAQRGLTEYANENGHLRTALLDVAKTSGTTHIWDHQATDWVPVTKYAASKAEATR